MKQILSVLFIFTFANTLLAQENGGPYLQDENTVLLMHFDGDASNSANVGNDGINHGSGVSYESGIHGQSLRLDNTTSDKQSWIEVPFYDELNFTEEFSIECWFKINSWGENHTEFPFILKKGESWQADYDIVLNPEQESLAANLNLIDEEFDRHSGVRTTDILETGQWYHIAVYFNFTHKHFYFVLRDNQHNEIFASHNYSYTSSFNSNDKLFIGFGNNNNTYFDGNIDELRISNKYRKYRDDIPSSINTSELKDSVAPLLRDKWKVYQWPFMAYFPRSTITDELHKGNSCGITATMRLIHFWEHPRFPQGNIDFDDGEFLWQADFDNTEYLFDQMPYAFGSNPTEEEYSAAATMVSQIGAASKFYHIGSGGAPVKTILEKYFKYKKELKFIYREEYTKEEWENIFKNELSHGRPILIEGTAERFDNGSWAGHYYICDGYNSENKFHTDLSIGAFEWWTDIDNFEYGQNQSALIFAESDWGDKTLTLTSPSGNDYYKVETDIEISWESENINNVIIEYSTDGGKIWTTISENTDASVVSYNWVLPNIVSNEYKVRISDIEDLNVYRRTGIFDVYDIQQFEFTYPKQNTQLLGGIPQPVYWQSEGIATFKLEYSVDGTNWTLISDSIHSSNQIEFEFPEIDEENVILRATDLLNNELTFTSESFSITTSESNSFVKKSDENTVLLMHFEEDLINSANSNLIPFEGMPVGYYIDNYDQNLGKAFRFDNSDGSPITHNIDVGNSEDLDIGNNWSMEAWVKVISVMGEKTVVAIIIDKWEAFGINGGWGHFNGFVNFENGTSVNFHHPETYLLNEWYHVAMISNASSEQILFYVHDKDFNKIYESSQAFPEGSNGLVKQTEYLLKIGGLGGGSNYEFDGFMDEVRISKTSYQSDYIVYTELPFYDDFEETIGGVGSFNMWTSENIEGWHYWHIIPWGGIDGSQCMRFENTDIIQNDWLITKPIWCEGVNQLRISFSHNFFGDRIAPKLYCKYILNDDSYSNWIEIDYTLGQNENQWYSNDDIIIENQGKGVYFAFQYLSDSEKSIYFLLDNFKVETILTNTENLILPKYEFQVFPNPITKQSIVSFNNPKSGKVNLSIYDMQGIKICTLLDKNLHAGSHTIQLGNQIQTSGVYFCKLSTERGVSTFRIVVK